jgi:hypothetical protein
MLLEDIINLTDVDAMNRVTLAQKYFYVMTLLTITNESHDYCLLQDDQKWHSIFRIGDGEGELPDPIEEHIDDLLLFMSETPPRHSGRGWRVEDSHTQHWRRAGRCPFPL